MHAFLAREDLAAARIGVLKRRYHGGVFRVRAARAALVCKTGDDAYDPACEAQMLDLLAAAGLTVPRALHHERGLLVLEDLRVEPSDAATLARAGSALARLHLDATAPAYGFGRPSAFGTLPLEAGWDGSWRRWFLRFRLMRFLEAAEARGFVAPDLGERIRAASGRLADLLTEPARPALLHGDVWANNVLSRNGAPVFLDPSALYGDPDYECAFLARYLDGQSFALRAYRATRPVRADFWRVKLPAYWLAFDLAHVALFGTRFLPAVHRSLGKIEGL